MKKILCLLPLVLLTGISIAGPTKITEIEKIRVRPNVTYVKLAGCPNYNQIYLDTEYGRAMYSAALTAATANKQVQVEFSAENGCETTESQFNYLEVKY